MIRQVPAPQTVFIHTSVKYLGVKRWFPVVLTHVPILTPTPVSTSKNSRAKGKNLHRSGINQPKTSYNWSKTGSQIKPCSNVPKRHQHFHTLLVGACTSLYKLVQVQKVPSSQAKQAMSEIPQVNFKFLFHREQRSLPLSKVIHSLEGLAGCPK